MVPLLPSVTLFSATERAALALASVVWTRRCLIRLQTRLASMAFRCVPVRPSLAVRFRCRINSGRQGFFLFGRLEQFRIDIHAQAQTQRLELVLDLVERFLSEIAILEHLGLGLHG